MGCNIFLTWQEAKKKKKKSNIATHFAVWQHLRGAGQEEGRVQGTHSLMEWIVLAYREACPNERDLPGHVGPCTSIEEV